MQYLGTSFSIVLGAWRLRLALALEDANEERPVAAPAREGARAHHLVAVADRRA